MIENSICFRLLTTEEAGIVRGGSANNNPYFGLISTGQTTEGKIMNADGANKDVTIYSAKNSSTTKEEKTPYVDISIPPYV